MSSDAEDARPEPGLVWPVAVPTGPPVPPSVMLTLVCRGCCCGTGKHLDVDHRRHLRELEATGVALEVTGCLGPCRLSNVVVAVDVERRQTWFGRVLDDRDLTAVAVWISDPKRHDRPDHLLQSPSAPQETGADLVIRDWQRRRQGGSPDPDVP